MSDHTHDCPRCNGYWPCDRDDCNSDDICLECQLEEKNAEVERLKAELVMTNNNLAQESGSNKKYEDFDRLKTRLEALEIVCKIAMEKLEATSREIDELASKYLPG